MNRMNVRQVHLDLTINSEQIVRPKFEDLLGSLNGRPRRRQINLLLHEKNDSSLFQPFETLPTFGAFLAVSIAAHMVAPPEMPVRMPCVFASSCMVVVVV